MSLSSETKKLLNDQISNFGPDFLEIGELWSTCFAVGVKVWKSNSRRPKFVGQSSKTKKVMGGSNFDDDSDFLEIGELWSTYFDVVGKPSGRATSQQNFVDQSPETKSYSVIKF